MNSNWFAAIALVLTLIVGGYAFTRPSVIVEKTPPSGSVSGPDRTNPCETADGTLSCFKRTGFIQASTTILAVRSILNATSTLRGTSGCQVTVSSTTASILTVAKATTAFATTTVIVNPIVVSANAQTTFQVATTTTNASAATGLFAPGTWLVIGMQGGTGTFTPSGSCSIIFDAIS